MNLTHFVFPVKTLVQFCKFYFFRKIPYLSCVVLFSILMISCSSWTNNSSNTLEKQIALQQIQHELATESVQAEQKTASDFEHRGDQYFQKNDITRAFLYYAKGLVIEPDNKTLLHKQAALLLKINKFAEAEQVFQKLLTQDGKDSLALTGRSRAYFSQGKFEEAELGFLAVLKINADSWLAYEYLGLICSQRHEHEKAISLFKTALSYKPKSVSVTNNLAVSYYLIGDFNEAIRLFREVVATVNDRKIHNNLALAYFQLGQFENALESFKKGSGSEAVAYSNIGKEYLSARKYNDAIAAFEKAIELNPRFYVSAQENLKKAKLGLSNNLAEN